MMWLSFADPDLPEGTQFLGVAVVEADSVVTGAIVCHALGINPGGEVLGVPLEPHMHPDESWRNRLLNRDEAEALSAKLDELFHNHPEEN